MNYEKPQVVDYGDLVELTAGLGLGSLEDGGSKNAIINLSIGIGIGIGTP